MPLPSGQPERRVGASTEALATSDRLARILLRLGIALAVYVAFAVTVASIFGVWNSFRTVDEAKKGAKYAQDGAGYAEQALEQAKINETIAKRNESVSKDVRHLVAQQAPCLEGDPPDSPACVRKAASDKIIGDALNAIALGGQIQHQDLVNVVAGLVGKRAPQLPIRTTARTTAPATTAPATTAPATTAPATVAPTTTTTTCPKLGKSNKCAKG